MYTDHRLRGHLYGIGYLKGGEYQKRHPRGNQAGPGGHGAELEASQVRIAELESRVSKLERTLGELVLRGMQKAAGESV